MQFVKLRAMGHIHSLPGQHDFTVSAFIVRTDTPEPTMMLHKHKKLKKYIQFGGHIELNETVWQAISHELIEESGYTLKELKILQPKVRIKSLSDAALHPYPAGLNTHMFKNEEHFHIDIEYAFVASGPPARGVAEGESKEFRLFTQSELNDLSNDQIFPNVKEISNFIFDDCLNEWELVDTDQFAL